MSFERIVGQDAAVMTLRKRLDSGVLPHALLFTGPDGVGKRTVAMELARCLVCPQRGCGECSHCRKASAGTHPDIGVVKPNDKSNINLPEIEGILKRVSMKPFEAAVHVVVVDDADRMNDECQNSFLKILEEPAPGTHFILVTSELRRLYPTVVSRCQRVTFNLLDENSLRTVLSGRKDADPANTVRTARLARGSLARIAQMDEGELEAAEERAFQMLSAAHSTEPDRMPPDRSRTTKDEALLEIDALADAFRDMLVLSVTTTAPARLLNPDRADALRRAASRYSAHRISDVLDTLGTARENIENSLNLRLVYADLWNQIGVPLKK